MQKKILISYDWNLPETEEIDNQIKERLQEEAENRIFQMRKDGYTSGELIHDDDDGYFRGWWSFSYTN